jgi:hypothetical protein
LSERLEVVELYDQLQEERLDTLQDELVTCISGAEGHGGEITYTWFQHPNIKVQVRVPGTLTGDSDGQ